MLMSPIFDETKTYVPAGRRYCVSNSQYWDCFMWCFHGQPKPRSRSLLTSNRFAQRGIERTQRSLSVLDRVQHVQGDVTDFHL